MANQIESRMHSSVKVAADGTIMAQTAAVVSVVHVPNSGAYLINYNSPIAAAEECHELCVAGIETEEGTIPVAGGALRISDTEYEIDMFEQGAPPVAADAAFSFTIWRLSSSNGV